MSLLLLRHRVRVGEVETGGILLATFTATDHAESGGALSRWTQNGVTGYDRANVQRQLFSGGSPSGTHAYKLAWGDSVGNVPGGAPNGRAEFGLVFPEGYGDELVMTWEQYIPAGSDDPNGPALQLTPDDGYRQFKVCRAWCLAPGESLSETGEESYGSNQKMGVSDFGIGAAGGYITYNFRSWDGGTITSGSQGGDPDFISGLAQHPPSGPRDNVYGTPSLFGRWVPVVARFKLATVEVSDANSPSNGIGQFWVDGVLQNYSGTDFRNYPGDGVSRAFRYAYIVGQRDTNTYPNECVWIDNIRVYKGGLP